MTEQDLIIQDLRREVEELKLRIAKGLPILEAALPVDIDRPTKSQFKRMAAQMGYEQVVHARWEAVAESQITGWEPAFAGCDPIGGYFCTNCHYEAIFDCNDEYVLSARCPNCGAKMEGEV